MPVHPGTPSRRRTAGVCARRAALGATAATVAIVGMPLIASAAPPTTPFISEISYDPPGADAGEFVEVQLPAGTSSSGLSIVLYNGSDGRTYDTDALPAVTAPVDAAAVAVLDYPADGIQNGGSDAIALVSGTTVLEFLSYEGTMTALDGPAAGMTSTDIGVAESGSPPIGQSLSRFYDADSGSLVWAGPAANSKGAVNTVPAAEPGPEPSTACQTTETHQIGQVQGNGDATPLADQTVTVRGVVVGDVPGFSGFYVQDADGDGDTATSDGVFVFSPVAVDLGDTVAVTGAAQEFGGQTQINAGDNAAVCAEGTAEDLPPAASLDLPAHDADRERLEGMRVAPGNPLTVSEVFDLTRFGELTLSAGGVLVQPTELARPRTAEANAIAAENSLRRIVLDDGSSARVTVATAPYLTPDTPVRVGDALDFDSPLVLGYGFTQWRLQPADGTPEGTFAPRNTREESPLDVGGDIQVGAFNVLNYFRTLTGPDARGATSPAEFEEQAAKIVTAINAMDADVVTLMEIEDTASTGLTPGNADAAVADLVDRLNDAAGSEKWNFVPLPAELYATGRDVIRNAIIYQPSSVTPVGDPVGLVDEENFDNAREPIAQTFVAAGDTFTVIGNHFKSKGSGSGANADQGDGQGASNPDRIGQAHALARFVAQLQDSTGDEDVIALGDLNAYSEEDPIVVLRDAGLTDLGAEFDPDRYSYVFDDMSGSLDHAMSTDSLTGKVTDLTHWNINSVESFAYQYTGDPELYAPHQYRSSDHDPLILGLDLAGPAVPSPVPVQLLAMNDFHGRISLTTGGDASVVTDPGPDGTYGTSDDVSSTVGGAANIASTVAERRAAFIGGGGARTGSYFVGAGDLISASPFESSVFKDEPTIEVLNAMGLDLSSVGNHEFDRGTDELRRISGATDGTFSDDVTACEGVTTEEEDPENATGCFTDSTANPFHGAEFPYLAANVELEGTDQPMLPPYQIYDVGGGQRMALIGVVTETTPTIVTPSGVADVEFVDEAQAINRYTLELQAMGIQAIGVLIHEGGTTSGAGASNSNGCANLTGPIVDINENVVPAVDLIVSAHTHAAYNCRLEDPLGNQRLVTQAGFYGKLITDIRLSIDPLTGDVDRAATYEATNVPVLRDDPDRDVQAIVDYWNARSAEARNEVVGEAAALIGNNASAVRNAEQPINNLLAQAALEALQDDQFGNPVIGFHNPGGTRASIEAGEVTYGELFNVQPFGNTINATTLTGSEIDRLLEEQFQLDRPTPEGRASQLILGTSEGFTYSYDLSRAFGDRVDPCSITLDGVMLDPGTGYRVAANSFLAGGGDRFDAFAPGADVTGPLDVDVLVSYFVEHSPVSPPAADHGTVAAPVTCAPPGDGGTPPGDGGTPPGDGGGTPPGHGGTPPGDGGGTPPASGGTPPVPGGTPSASGGTSPVTSDGTPGREVTASSGGGRQLAYTGTEVGQLIGLAGLLTLAGATSLVIGRRRRGLAD
ncbi:MAG: Endonuclease/exonuclease/phosphatase [Blastococcus sp.]|nr:Endonuclease/exonuclease/phosphatase [Blastococcus sp.]